jgi:hypothetical protein
VRQIAVLGTISLVLSACGGDDPQDKIKRADHQVKQAEKKADRAAKRLYSASARVGVARLNVAVARLCSRISRQGRLPTRSEQSQLDRQFQLAKRFARNYPQVYSEFESKLTVSFGICAPDLAQRLPVGG